MIRAARAFPPDRPAPTGDGPLGALVAALCDLDLASVDGGTVATLLRSTPLSAAELGPYRSFAPGRYTRNGVYRDESFEVLVLCWDAASASPVHDHGDSRCFVSVVHGAMRVENYVLTEAGRQPGPARLEAGPTEILPQGGIDVRSPARDIHRMTPAGGAAISLHVYAPALDESLVYDIAQRTCRRARVRYDREPRRPVAQR